MNYEQILELIQQGPDKLGFTEETVKDQVYICLKCLNSWKDKGFHIEGILKVTCNNCQHIVWQNEKV